MNVKLQALRFKSSELESLSLPPDLSSSFYFFSHTDNYYLTTPQTLISRRFFSVKVVCDHHQTED